jgi:hypothetical protein
VSAVIVMEECRSIALTIFRSAPPARGQRGSVAEVVKSDRRQVRVADHPVEGPADEVRMQEAAVLAGEGDGARR